jgi:hypothetical protein
MSIDLKVGDYFAVRKGNIQAWGKQLKILKLPETSQGVYFVEFSKRGTKKSIHGLYKEEILNIIVNK